MTETRTTRNRRRTERHRRGVVLVVALVLLLADAVTAASGAVGGVGVRVHTTGSVASGAPGDTTTSVAVAAPATATSTATSTTVAARVGGASTGTAGGAGTGSSGGTGGTAVTGGGCGYGACLTLDASQTTGAFGHAGSGINELPGVPSSELRAVGTNMYRSVPGYSNGQLDWSGWDAAVASGAKTTLILSTLWALYYGKQYPPTPWSDWNAYNSWVKSTVESAVAGGHEVDYWDIFNEPGWPGQYSSADFASETPGDELLQFQNAYRDIRSVLPSAQIVGPSLGLMLFSPIPAGSAEWRANHEVDMTTFLDFCAQQNLSLAAVAWHQNGAPPAQIDQWAAQTWALIRSLPAIGHPLMYLDEYAAQPTQPVPGWDVGYLAALQSSGFTYSVRSCWDGCLPSTLDGLLLSNGAPTSEVTEREAYAAISGQAITTSSTDPNMAALGAVSSGQVSALIGRMRGCGSPASWCNQWPYPWFGSYPAESVGVTVVLPWTAANVNIKLSHVSSEPGTAVSGATVDDPTGVQLSPDGTGRELLTFSVPSFADGDAYILNVSQS